MVRDTNRRGVSKISINGTKAHLKFEISFNCKKGEDDFSCFCTEKAGVSVAFFQYKKRSNYRVTDSGYI